MPVLLKIFVGWSNSEEFVLLHVAKWPSGIVFQSYTLFCRFILFYLCILWLFAADTTFSIIKFLSDMTFFLLDAS